MRSRPRIRRSSGFTLVELIIVIVLLGILAAVGSNMISDSFTTTRMVDASQASTAQARYALERLAREIREVKFTGTAFTVNYAITTMNATNMVFTRTINGTDVTVTISSSGGNLTLLYTPPGGTASTLASQVSGFALSYLDVAGTATTDTSLVRFVVIDLTLTDATSGQSISQRTRVALRNA